MMTRKVAVTGANGFIGSRLLQELRSDTRFDVHPIVRSDDQDDIRASLSGAHVIAHMAGVTRPRDVREFEEGNRLLTENLAELVRATGGTPLVIFASTVRALEDTEYGRTKRAAEDVLLRLAEETGSSVAIFRLGQVFGRGARPNYNAISATLLANAAQGRDTRVDTPEASLELVDVRHVVAAMTQCALDPPAGATVLRVEQSHRTTVGAVAGLATAFREGALPDCHDQLQVELFEAFRSYAETVNAPGALRTP